VWSEEYDGDIGTYQIIMVLSRMYILFSFVLFFSFVFFFWLVSSGQAAQAMGGRYPL